MEDDHEGSVHHCVDTSTTENGGDNVFVSQKWFPVVRFPVSRDRKQKDRKGKKERRRKRREGRGGRINGNED